MKRRKVLLGLVAAFVSLFLTVLAVEVVLRVYAATSATDLAVALARDPLDVLVEPHGEVGYRPRSSRIIRYDDFGATATTNEMGFRGPTVAVPKPGV